MMSVGEERCRNDELAKSVAFIVDHRKSSFFIIGTLIFRPTGPTFCEGAKEGDNGGSL
jgi:hypothetical protein